MDSPLAACVAVVQPTDHRIEFRVSNLSEELTLQEMKVLFQDLQRCRKILRVLDELKSFDKLSIETESLLYYGRSIDLPIGENTICSDKLSDSFDLFDWLIRGLHGVKAQMLVHFCLWDLRQA